MATITSPGIGSGLDVQSIVSQLVALERAPVNLLKTQATSTQAKLSLYGTIQSQVSKLQDAAAKLGSADGWNAVNTTSSNAAAVSVTASAGAATNGLSIEVQNLAKAQSTASATVAVDAPIGSGSMSIELGQWSGGTFAPGSGSAVSITINPGEDTLSAIAAKINGADAGVSATVLRDASGERLLLRSKDTGEVNGFRIQVTDDDGVHDDGTGLSSLSYDPVASPPPGGFNGMTRTQAGENARATINNVAVVSASNKLNDSLPNLKITLSQVTTAPVEIQVNNDTAAAKKNVQSFVDAYNALNQTISNATAYNADSKVGGPLQGDSTTVGLQNALRGMMRSVTASSPFQSLSDVGIEMKTGGALEIKAEKLDTALGNLAGIKALFTTNTGEATTQGFGLKIKDFTTALLATGGLINNKNDSLKSAIKRNGLEQEKVNDRADRAQVRLLRQYNAMDANVARLNSINAFVAQQITLWNKSTA
ncbi:flagellar filament capping protein FliD [Hydrogenophaga sp.]|uniref:flagellar filament capping protein FliD n=1 Tax=Hydrogenophaga sp. TaxID=1904254 RepID=UPI0035656AC1